jgi:hypothetical protein
MHVHDYVCNCNDSDKDLSVGHRGLGAAREDITFRRHAATAANGLGHITRHYLLDSAAGRPRLLNLNADRAIRCKLGDSDASGPGRRRAWLSLLG